MNDIPKEFICKHCDGDIRIRNPKGNCDHLYYPDSCEVCKKANTPSLNKQLETLINKASRENESNTPDFLLAEFMMGCLKAGEEMINARDKWYNVKLGIKQI